MRMRERIEILIILAILLTFPTKLSAQSYSVDYKRESIEHVLEDLKRMTGYEFVYQKQAVAHIPDITCKCSHSNLKELLDEVLGERGIGYEIVGKIIILKAGDSRQHQAISVNGTLVDDTGIPLGYATVKVKGSKTGTVTDADGKFSLMVEGEKRPTLEFSYVGFLPVSRTITNAEKARNMKVVMHEDKSQLDEVVVTGYQVLNKRSLTSAVTTAKMEDLERTDVSSIDQMLEGKIPDLLVTNNSGEIGVAPKIRIRGTSTLIGNREPLWVVDGIVVKDPVSISPEELNDPDYVNRIGNAIAGINPQDIERIDVLKDAAATAIYGTKAANGVIVVTTKRGYEGKPQVSYNFSTNFKLRPRYSDSSVDVMDSKERIQFSRELYLDHYKYSSSMTTVGYEDALLKLYNGQYNYSQFTDAVSSYETQNTDWFDLLCQDSWSSQHTASISGGSKQTRYYASMGYNKDNDVVKANSNERYTWSMNLDNTFSRLLTASFTFNAYHYARNYYQDEIAPLNYAYTTSRCIPAYDSEGQYYYYNKKSSSYSGYNYNILNELENSYKKQKVNSMTFTANLQFTFTDWLKANAILSVTHQNTDIEGWWGERSYHIAALRGSDYGSSETNYDTNTCPQGGELTKESVTDRNYTARFQLDANKFFGPDDKHNIDATFGIEISSDKYKEHSSTARGYFRDRGETFVSDIDPTKYTAYAAWLASNTPSITDNLTNTASAYLSLTYAYKTLWRVNLNGRVDGSNKFGDRSNDKFLPVWSLSGSYDVSHWLKAE